MNDIPHVQLKANVHKICEAKLSEDVQNFV